MEGHIQEDNDFFNYQKQRWTTRLKYAAYIGGLISLGGYRIKQGIREIFLHWKYAVDLCASIALVFATITLIHWVSLILDRAIPWDKRPQDRFVAQFILGWCFGYLAMEYLNDLYVAYGGRNLLWVRNAVTQVPLSFLVSMTVNCYYYGAYFAEKNHRMLHRSDSTVSPGYSAPDATESTAAAVPSGSGLEVASEPAEATTGIPVHGQKKEKLPLITYADGERILVQHLDIAAVGLEGGVLAIYTFSGRRYYDTRSVKEFFALLDPNEYYYTSRQTIVHRNAVKSIVPSKTKHKSIQVLLTVDVPFVIEVAERKVAHFKAWLAAGDTPDMPKRTVPVPMLL